MKTVKFFLIVVISSFLFANDDYGQYKPQKFFDESDLNILTKNSSGELLKKIVMNNEVLFMTQDGDLYDEDVADIPEESMSLSTEPSFSKSKRLLALNVYKDYKKAFYSGCDYKIENKSLIPIHKSCGFKYRKNEKRSKRMEWEHIVPAWHFGYQLMCWQKGGRATCKQESEKFRIMEADMHNLVPAIGEINGDRSNFQYGMIQGEERVYGKVDMEINFSDKRAEPSENVYGDIARAYFYMRDKYGLKISHSQTKLFIAWNNLDPVSKWEKEKNQIVKSLQGDENLYITNYKKMKQLGDDIKDSEKDTTTQNKKNSREFKDIHDELSNQYKDILDKLPPWLSTLILLILSLIVWFIRNKKHIKIKEQISKQTKETKESKDKKYLMVTKLTNSALCIDENGDVVIKKIDKNNPNQHWSLVKGNQAKEIYFLYNSNLDKVIEVEDGSQKDGANIVLNDKKRSKNDHQEWILEPSSDSYIFIVNLKTSNVLDVKSKNINDGTKIVNYHKKTRGVENQEWKLIEV